MPTEVSNTAVRSWLAGCIVHQDLPTGAHRADVTVNGRAFPALLDSGSAVSLVQTRIVPPRGESRAFLPITCVHGDTRHVPARVVTILAGIGSWPVEVGVVEDLPVPVLLGRNWPGFDRLLTAAVQSAGRKRGRRHRRADQEDRHHPALMASDSGREGEPPR